MSTPALPALRRLRREAARAQGVEASWDPSREVRQAGAQCPSAGLPGQAVPPPHRRHEGRAAPAGARGTAWPAPHCPGNLQGLLLGKRELGQASFPPALQAWMAKAASCGAHAGWEPRARGGLQGAALCPGTPKASRGAQVAAGGTIKWTAFLSERGQSLQGHQLLENEGNSNLGT